MSTLSNVKKIASIALCIAFFLPLSQCSQKEGIAQTRPAPTQIAAYSAYEWPSVESTIAVMLFFWPIGVQSFAIIYPRRVQREKLMIAEISLCALTFSGITWLVFFGDSLRYGAFVAYGAIIAYSVSSIKSVIGGRQIDASENAR